ncbi:LamG domain-containing protein [Marinobacterium lutimaris]|uniref:Concanavalin A-like lectin/glucanases superfamily protein n=1 Tax=Marinobacterium lutimaris TaxID=568106 RepID=A0A1H5Y939_9GAMM|nr:LamG domain-containing protein [Marinobacterium lutimaris]SEG20100.1 Concanavalin A-like lectin/glucanases superfamily protein [Marinobacterium lutimaris]
MFHNMARAAAGLAGGGGDGSGDPYFANVAALLHMDGANTSTMFADEIGGSWVAIGSAQIDTDESKFGGASGYFDGASNVLSSASSAYNIGTSDFTIECWIKPSAVIGTYRVIASRQSDSSSSAIALQLRINTVGQLEAVLRGGTTTIYTVSSSGTLSTTAFQHVAVTRESGVLRCFINGTLDGVQGGANSTLNDVSAQFSIGSIDTPTSGPTSFYSGWVDDFRLTIGVARYTDSFTLPTSTFPNE